MTSTRAAVLILGPALLVGGSLALSSDRGTAELREIAGRAWISVFPEDEAPPPSPSSERAEPQLAVPGPQPPAPGPRAADRAAPPHQALACEDKAAAIRKRMADDCHVIVRPPFIVGGDGTEQDLAEAYDRLLAPLAQALGRCYFDTPPHAPLTVLMFSGDDAFQNHARRFDQRRRHDYYGYYRREDRRVMLNASTGAGTVAHELTHALAHFDFPAMPEWFDEGLASLHEEAEFSDDGTAIVGHSNWRVNHLLLGLRRGQLRRIEDFITAKEAMRPGLEAVDYAHARYLCLFLQERKLLETFYRQLRADVSRDPTGCDTLRALVAPKSLDDFDREFRAWIARFHPVSRCQPVRVEFL